MLHPPMTPSYPRGTLEAYPVRCRRGVDRPFDVDHFVVFKLYHGVILTSHYAAVPVWVAVPSSLLCQTCSTTIPRKVPGPLPGSSDRVTVTVPGPEILAIGAVTSRAVRHAGCMPRITGELNLRT